MTCEARQYSDTMRCERCKLVWDTNDPHPPTCPLDRPSRTDAVIRLLFCVFMALVIMGCGIMWGVLR